MKKTVLLTLALVLMSAAVYAQQPAAEAPAAPTPTSTPIPAVGAQTQSQSPAQFAPGTVIPLELSKSIDAKKIKAGDQVEARTSVDMLSNGKIIMPRNTKALGHVTSVKAHTKESPDSMVAIAFDRLIMKDGQELPLHVSVQAIGAPLNSFTANSASRDPDAPVGPMGGGVPGGSAGGGMGGSRSSGTSPQPNYPAGGMPTTPDGTAPHGSSTGALSASSQGVVGLKDLSLSATPEASVVSSSNKNVHLDGGTQLMLRAQ